MTIATRKSRLFDPNGTEPVGSGTPALPFASLPDPSTVSGQVRIASDVGPAPGIELISNGTIWRPRGGRQVLAMRALNPVTVQDLAGAVAETIGSFPGGLVRSGMQLEMDVRLLHGGISTSSRIAALRVGDGATRAVFSRATSSTSGAVLRGRTAGTLDVLSDTSIAHAAGFNGGSYSLGNSTLYNPVVNFSLPWSVDIFLTSVSETAVAITSSSWAAGIATFVTSADHTLAVGDKTVTAGVTPSGYNVAAGSIVTEVPTTTSFKVAIASDPVGNGSGGTSSRISNMILQSYVLELVG